LFTGDADVLSTNRNIKCVRGILSFWKRTIQGFATAVGMPELYLIYLLTAIG
jgi:hypothetical protein